MMAAYRQTHSPIQYGLRVVGRLPLGVYIHRMNQVMTAVCLRSCKGLSLSRCVIYCQVIIIIMNNMNNTNRN